MIRIDIPELGDSQFVEIKNPKFLPWGMQKEITALVMGDNKAAQLDVAEKVAIALVKSGNVINEDGVPFSFPLTESNIKDIPGVVIEKVAEKFAELKGENKERKN